MKKFLALLLTLCLFLLPLSQQSRAAAQSIPEDTSFVESLSGMNDPDLLPYLEDTIYTSLVDELDSEEYFVEEVKAVYISQEYLDEVAFNSQANIFFGYTLAELDEQFTDSKYIFTLGNDGSTVVEPFTEYYDDTYERIIKNVTMGTGVILVCVTVSVVSSGVGTGAVSFYFALAAKTATTMALTGGALGAASSGFLTYVQTGNIDESLKSAALGGSEVFKWGAIGGSVKGLAQAIQIEDLVDDLVDDVLADKLFNSEKHYFPEGSEKALKYPDGVLFTEGSDGKMYPRFEDYAIKTLKYDVPSFEAIAKRTSLTGIQSIDTYWANKLAGFKTTPKGYVWHHVEDMQTLILIPKDLHSMYHHGGASLIRHLFPIK